MRRQKKNPTVILSVSVIVAGLFICLMGVSVKADNFHISSKGNFILEDGTKAAIYADDIYYIQKEIAELFNEIK